MATWTPPTPMPEAKCGVCGNTQIVLNGRLLSHIDTTHQPMLLCLGSGAISEATKETTDHA